MRPDPSAGRGQQFDPVSAPRMQDSADLGPLILPSGSGHRASLLFSFLFFFRTTPLSASFLVQL